MSMKFPMPILVMELSETLRLAEIITVLLRSPSAPGVGGRENTEHISIKKKRRKGDPFNDIRRTAVRGCFSLFRRLGE